MDNWYNKGFLCLRCNNTGHIPILWYYNNVGILMPTETLLLCGCKNSKEYWYMENISYTDETTGKSVKTKTKKYLSQNHDNVFDSLQFIWNEKICFSREPHIDYPEVYLASKHKSLRHFKQTGEAKILSYY